MADILKNPQGKMTKRDTMVKRISKDMQKL